MTTQGESGLWRCVPWLCGAVLFAFMLHLYVHVMPVVAWNGDDWKYLSQFRDLFPSLTRGNPARILPEALHPLVGWAAAFLYAYSGDYAQALVWSHALLLAAGVTALGMVLYLALRGILRDAPLALFAAAFFMALSFSLFKSRPEGNVFLFHSDCLTMSTFYVLPNLVNSIVLCGILYIHATGVCLCRPDSLRAGCCVLLLFLAQFSMTFGSAMAAAAAGWVLLRRLWRRPEASLRARIAAYARAGAFFDALLVILIAFWVIAAVLDICGGRFNRIQHAHWDFAGAWQAFAGLIAQLNPAVCVVAAVLVIAACVHVARKRLGSAWNEEDVRFVELIVICVLSAVILLCLDLLIAAKTFIMLAARISAVYNAAFCGVLAVTLCACYLLRDAPRLKPAAPLLLALLFVECANAEKPWARQNPVEHAVVERWIQDVRAAQERGETAVIITVPKAEWPHPKETFGKLLSRTLFAHGVTIRRMDIALREAYQ
ncbi:MAG: hypothetical protein FWH34_06655 [Desulfovibrionaceae bacterium]|nr:hypothetical protein [Desulfovibrionaceae bacterium]